MKSVGLWINFNSFTAIHVIMLELKNNKHNTHYCCTYLYNLVNAIIFKLLLTSYLKRDLAKKTTTITISVRAKVLHNPFVQYSLNILEIWIDLAILTNLLFRQETLSKLLANHNALGQLTNHNRFRFSEGGPSSNPELIELFLSGWGERYCNNVDYVKNNAIFKPPIMKACSSTPPQTKSRLCKRA